MEKLKQAPLSGEILASLIETIASRMEEIGAADGTLAFGYVAEGDEQPRPGDLVPEIILRVRPWGG